MSLFDEISKVQASVNALQASVSAIAAPDLSKLATADQATAIKTELDAVAAAVGNPPAPPAPPAA